jgi:hypothetical protein
MASRRRRAILCSAMSMGSAIELYWIPLGAGGRSVRLNGQVYEFLSSLIQRRPPRELYHSALVVSTPDERFVIESAPIPRPGHPDRGVVAEGPVGNRWAGRFRLFRYELRRWRDGSIPDLAEAVDSPRRLSDDPEQARRLLELVPYVPNPVWGRDELHTGEMWNSNSMVAWLLARSELPAEQIQPPAGGRAPGWMAGVIVARRGAGK